MVCSLLTSLIASWVTLPPRWTFCFFHISGTSSVSPSQSPTLSLLSVRVPFFFHASSSMSFRSQFKFMSSERSSWSLYLMYCLLPPTPLLFIPSIISLLVILISQDYFVYSLVLVFDCLFLTPGCKLHAIRIGTDRLFSSVVTPALSSMLGTEQILNTYLMNKWMGKYSKFHFPPLLSLTWATNRIPEFLHLPFYNHIC